jgi:hypothetical protein
VCVCVCVLGAGSFEGMRRVTKGNVKEVIEQGERGTERDF